MRFALFLVVALSINGLALAASDVTWDTFEASWKAGRIDEAIGLAKTLVRETDDGLITGRVVRADGQPLTQDDRDLVSVLPKILAFNDYWSADGRYLLKLPFGRYKIAARGTTYSGASEWIDLRRRELVDAGTVTLHPLSLDGVPRVRITLNVKRADFPEGPPITASAAALDNRKFVAQSAANGDVVLDIPRVKGRFRISTECPGYASVWSFITVTDKSEHFELGRFELTRLKQAAIRWRMTKSPSWPVGGANAEEGTATLRSYDQFWRNGELIGRKYSFRERKHIEIYMKELGDIELVQAGNGVPLVEVEPGRFVTSSLEFYPGTMAHMNAGRAVMADLGPGRLEDVTEVREQDLKPYNGRTGVPVVVGHRYALRSFDGERQVLFIVDSVADQPRP